MTKDYIEKTFIEALEVLALEPSKTKKFLNDKRISFVEKKILKASLELRDGKSENVIKILENLDCESDIVDSQRCYFLASAHNNLSSYPEAIKYFERSLALGEQYDIHFRDFSIIYGLIICYMNLKDSKQIAIYCNRLFQIGAKGSKQKIDLLFASYYSEITRHNLSEAQHILVTIEQKWDELSDHQRILLLFEEFDLAIKSTQYDNASLILEKFKSVKKFYNKASFKFMRALLDNLIDDKEIYLYDKDFQNQPIFHLEMKVICALREGRNDDAQAHWLELSLDNPKLYAPDFKYNGDICLFSLCLEKNLQRESTAPLTLPEGMSKEDKLIHILRNRGTLVSKSEVFRLIYDREAESKDDLHKLTALVSHIRKKNKLNIKTQKGCYYLAS